MIQTVFGVQMKNFLSKSLLVGMFSTGFVACTSFQGEYSDPNKEEIVDDRWNETDARKTAEVMVKGALSRPWLQIYKQSHNGAKPIVLVDEIENRTDEHIDTAALTEFIRNELINSGQIRFVNNAKRQKILDEVKYQQSGAVRKDQAKSLGKQLGVDFMLSGAMSSIVAQQDKLKTVTYQTNLTLTNLETSEIEFSDKHLIKKRFKRSALGL